MSEYGRAHKKVRDEWQREMEIDSLKPIECAIVKPFDDRIALLLSQGYEPFGHEFTDRGLVVVFWKRPVLDKAALRAVEWDRVGTAMGDAIKRGFARGLGLSDDKEDA